jgi:charged multivesicular body protein 3
MGLFGKDKNPTEKAKEKVDEMCKTLRHESHQLDRQIYAIEREEQKTVASLKQAAKKNDKDVCKILAKSIVQLRRFFLLKSFSLLIIFHS